MRGGEGGRPRAALGKEIERNSRRGNVRADESSQEFGELRDGGGALRHRQLVTFFGLSEGTFMRRFSG